MWEANLASPHGVFTVRRILNYVLATIVAAFLWVVLAAPLTHAATDATWNNGSIVYAGNTYNGPTISDGKSVPPLPINTTYYQYTAPADLSGMGKAYVIYFAPGIDPGTANSAQYITYTISDGLYNNPSLSTTLSLTQLNASSATDNSANSSSCSINGIGWFVCPVTTFLAWGMDHVFDMLKGFLTVKPLVTQTDNSLYKAWSYMRSFANIAFVIAFLLIIYSQLTNVGLNNYSVKKLLPRLIVAAILVNISYYICAVAVDISNITGDALQQMFVNLRHSLTGPNTNSMASFQSVSGFILSGGTAATAAVIGISSLVVGTSGSAAAAIILLLPMLLGLLLAVLVALVVLAARQALIIILIILAPLAFVAYLLPNTEKLFDKWRSTFMTLLVFFPLFALIFGGSQIAAFLIIQNADQINIVLLAMFVQVAPLVLTPLLVKFSGGVVGRIAGMVNNPSKGLLDRTKNWAKNESEYQAAKKRVSTPVKPRQLARRYSQHMYNRRRTREDNKKDFDAQADNLYHDSKEYQRVHESQHQTETSKKTIDERLSRDLSRKMQSNSYMMEHEMTMRLTTDEAATAKLQIDKVHEELRAGKVDSHYDNTDIGRVLSELSEGSALATRNLALSSYAAQTAKRVQQVNLAESLIRNDSTVDGKLLRDYAGGIDRVNGAKSALAFAMAQKGEAEAKLENEQQQLIKQFKLNGTDRQDLAMGRRVVEGKYQIGNQTYKYEFTPDDEFARSAARSLQLAGEGSFGDILEIVENSGVSFVDSLSEISKAIPANGIPDKAAWMGGVFIDKVLRGEIVDRASVHREIINSYIMKGTVKPGVLAKNDADAIKVLAEAIRIAPRTPELNTKLAELKNTIGLILDEKSDYYAATSDASRIAFKNLDKML